MQMRNFNTDIDYSTYKIFFQVPAQLPENFSPRPVFLKSKIFVKKRFNSRMPLEFFLFLYYNKHGCRANIPLRKVFGKFRNTFFKKGF